MELFLVYDKQFRDIIPVTCGQEKCAPSHSFGPATRKYYLIHYVVSGKGCFYIDGQEYHLSAGQCFIIRPEEVTLYRADREDPWHYIWVGFHCQLPLPLSMKQNVWSHHGLGDVFTSLVKGGHRENGREEFVCGKIFELISLMMDDVHADVPKRNYVERAKDYMEAEYPNGVNVQKIADVLNLDRSYFSQLFKKQEGVSPLAYLCTLRLEKAAALLKQGYPPGVVAQSTGYSDVCAFSRMFHRRFGLSPSAYQKNERKCELT